MTVIFSILLLPMLLQISVGCKHEFQGFGIYLGRLDSFNTTSKELRSSILSHLYNDLSIRHYRSEYQPSFSLKEKDYNIQCIDTQSCAWITVHREFSELPDDKSLIASVWSPPHYMKNVFRELKPEYEESYYYYIKNITALIKKEYNLTVERVSIANEPENMFARWDECVMSAKQLCQIVQTHSDDSLISMCPENAWFDVSKVYRDYAFDGVSCRRACKTIISHGYKLSVNPLYWGTVYYDLEKYEEDTASPVWITEISSTHPWAHSNQMMEAIDMSEAIVNFVGTTCVQRFYFWSAYSIQSSGESLIWLDKSKTKLVLPKKYWAYRHFTLAAFGSTSRFDCSTTDYLCLRFENKFVYVNKNYRARYFNDICRNELCCTTDDYDYQCSDSNRLPARSVCSC